MLMLPTSLFAQDDGSNVSIFFVACEDRTVIDFTGFAESNIDIFYQVFNLAGGQGDALTDFLRVSVDGVYTVSQDVPYKN
jgi:hypothetical protein